LAAEYTQKWTPTKVISYIAYYVIAKHLPEPDQWGLIGKLSHKFRSFVCKPLFRECAKQVGVGKGVHFDTGCNLVMRERANIGAYSIIEAACATVTIGRDVMMGKHCIIVAQNHKYLDEGYDGFEGKDILIDDHAWIGHRAIILPGVRVGKHAIVGAGAVVSKNIPDYAIAVGNPAVVKKYRRKE